MEPMTMLAIAQAGVAAVQTVWNYFAGNSALAQEKARQAKSRDSLNQGYQQGKAALATSFAQGQKDVSAAASSTSAGLAQRGVVGPQNDIQTEAVLNQGNQQLDTSMAQRTQAMELQFAQQNDQLDYAAQDLQAQQDQLNMDTLLGGIGVGLSAAGAIMKDPGFGKKSPATPTTPELRAAMRGDYGNTLPNANLPSGYTDNWNQDSTGNFSDPTTTVDMYGIRGPHAGYDMSFDLMRPWRVPPKGRAPAAAF